MSDPLPCIGGSGEGEAIDDGDVSGALSDALLALITAQLVVTLPACAGFLWLRTRHGKIYAPRCLPEYHADVPGSSGEWEGAKEPMEPLSAVGISPISFLKAVHAIPVDAIAAKSGPEFALFMLLAQKLFYFFAILFVTFVGPILTPVTATGESPANLTGIRRLTLGNIASGSPRFWVHCLGAYVFTALALYFIRGLYHDYQRLRIKYASRHTAANYSVMVSGLPQGSALLPAALRHKVVRHQDLEAAAGDEDDNGPVLNPNTTDEVLRGFFEELAPGKVVSARVAIMAPALIKKRSELDKAMRKLERALVDAEDAREADKPPPMARNPDTRAAGNFFLGDKVEAVPFWTKRIEDLKLEITVLQGDPDAALEVLSPMQLAKRATAISKAASGAAVAKARSGRKNRAADDDAKEAKTVNSGDELPDGMPPLAPGVQPSGKHLTTFGFVTFSDIDTARRMSQLVLTRNPKEFSASPAPSPEDIIWGSFSVAGINRDARAVGVRALIAYMMVIWGSILVAVAQLANLQAYANEPGIGPIISSLPKGFLAFLSGVLPPVMVGVVISLVPTIFAALAKFEGVRTYSKTEQQVASWYFIFLFVTIFIFQAFSTASAQLIESFSCLVQQPFAIVDLLGIKLPESAFLFVLFVVQSSLSVQVLKLLGIPRLAKMLVFNKWLAKTPRERKEAAQPPYFRFGVELGFTLFMFVLCFTYSIMSPLMGIASLVYFGVAYIRIKYNLAYVHIPAYQAGGAFFPFAMSRMVAVLYLFQITVLGVLSVKGFTGVLVLIPLPVLTYYVYHNILDEYSRSSAHLPEYEALRVDKSEVGGGEFTDGYVHPAFRPLEMGWDAKFQRTPIADFQQLAAVRRNSIVSRQSGRDDEDAEGCDSGDEQPAKVSRGASATLKSFTKRAASVVKTRSGPGSSARSPDSRRSSHEMAPTAGASSTTGSAAATSRPAQRRRRASLADAASAQGTSGRSSKSPGSRKASSQHRRSRRGSSAVEGQQH